MSQTHLSHFDATSASFTQTCRKTSNGWVDANFGCQAPRLSCYSLQHLQYRAPLFSPFIERRRKTFALVLRGPALRVWLPSRRCQPLGTLEACFSFQRSWDSLFRALFLPHGQPALSSRLSAPALFPKTLPGFLAALQRLDPTGKAVVPLLLSEGLTRIGTRCSPEPSDLLGILLFAARFGVISTSNLPSRS
jgi:hypothetical protein